MKRVLFIDRDGTVIVEPPVTFQVDSLEKLEFYPKVIRNLHRIAAEMPFELVMVTNQDGLGTDSFPEETFRPPHLKMLTTLAGEGIEFAEILIDRSFEYENAPTRKPRTGLLRHYLNNPEYDLANSYVIGDRPTDMELAYNLGAKGILVGSPTRDWTFANEKVEEAIVLISPDWDEIYEFLHTEQTLSPSAERAATHQRKTLETHISLQLNLDGEGRAEISTGIGFLDHMLEQIAKHARIDLTLHAKGDLHIEAHHTIEDVGIALGEAFAKALGNKRGIERYGFAILPMDESLAQVAIDFSGRPWLMWQGAFRREMLGDYPTEMTQHFFKSFSDNAKCNLNIKVEGENDHHQTEIIYKAFAKAVRNAIRREANNFDLPSTKGVL